MRYIILTLAVLYCQQAQAMDLTKAVIHHTASPDVSASTINQWHIEERGWDEIGYHFVIRADGTMEKGRSTSKKGAHALGRNERIGIVLTGYDEYSDEQIYRLKKLLMDNKIRSIENHHEKCPGPGLPIREIARELGIEYIKIGR